MSEVTPQDIQDMRDEAVRLDRAAALLERQAAARYEDSARLYRGGSSTFVRSIDVADGYVQGWWGSLVSVTRARAAHWAYRPCGPAASLRAAGPVPPGRAAARVRRR